MKVMTIVGTRPEIIKLCRVIAELDRHVEHVLVHTGQNYDYELNEIFFQQLGIRKPDHFLEAAGKTAAQTIATVIARADDLMAEIQPDALLLLGDTNSCLSVIAAKRRKIPIFHMEAGNRCFDQRVPEEINRKIVDHTSDINLTYTEHARRYLLAEGVRPETVIKTGSPMKEVLDYYLPQIEVSQIHKELTLQPGKYFVVSAHREENVDNESNFRNLLASLNRLAQDYSYPVIVSTHPRTRKRLETLNANDCDPLIHFIKPLGFFDYVKLQIEAKCVISDSGTITEEASILGFPAVTIRQAHERPEGMDEGTLIMCGLIQDNVLDAVQVVTAQQQPQKRLRLINDYDTDSVSTKVLRVILSYTDYVNRTVWFKTDVLKCSTTEG
ncbi:MAG: UDP-N-acetylglucosamine 2-epimerase (non-hydrolyzing) [Geobacteraceae bacterium]|nr:UDP-N-acetylglucosamine 2-epimerase (non-hydrolyzing) [Geobacteraceae bacterium]